MSLVMLLLLLLLLLLLSASGIPRCDVPRRYNNELINIPVLLTNLPPYMRFAVHHYGICVLYVITPA